MPNNYNKDLLINKPTTVVNTENNYDKDLLSKSLFSPDKEYRSTPFGVNTPDIKYDKQFFEDNPNQYVSPENISNIQESVANNQSGWDLAGSVINQAITGEIVGGTIAGIGTILRPDKIVGRMTGAKDAWETSMIEQFGMDIQDWAREATPIYTTKNAQQNFAPEDITWWAQLAPSMASTLSIMIPAAGVSSLVRLAVNGARAARVASGAGQLGKLFKASEGLTAWGLVRKLDIAREASNIKNIPLIATNILAPAVASRLLDSTREGLGRHEQAYNYYKEVFKNEKDGDAKAKQFADEIAQSGYVKSFKNIGFDILEWTLLGKLGKVRNQNLDNIGKAVLSKNAEQFGTEAVTKSILGLPTMKTIVKSKLTSALKVGLLEGFDETAMDFFMNEGERKTLIRHGYLQDDGTSSIQRYIEHHGVPKNWDSFVGGFLGGTAMGGMFAGYGKIKNTYFNEKYNNQVERLAQDFIEESDDLIESVQLHAKAKADGRIAEAHHLMTDILSKLATKSSLNGTLPLFREMLQNISNLDTKSKDSVAFLKELGDEDFKTLQQDFSDLAKKLEKAESLFTTEKGKVRTGGQYNELLGAQIADYKLRIQLHKDYLEELNKEFGTAEVDKQVLDEHTKERLQNLNENAMAYYSELEKLEKTKLSHQKMIESYEVAINIKESEIKELESNIEFNKNKATNTNLTKKQQATFNKIIANQQEKIKAINKKIESDKKSIEDYKNKTTNAETTLSEITKTYLDFSSFKGEVERELSVNKSNKDNLYLGNHKNVKDAIDIVIQKLNDAINKAETVEGATEFGEDIEQSNKFKADMFVAIAEEEIEKLNTKEELDEYLLKLEKENNISDDVRDKVVKAIKSRISEINKAKEEIEIIENSRKPNTVTSEGSTTDSETSRTLPFTRSDEVLEQSSVNVTNNGVFKVGSKAYIIENGKARYNVPFTILAMDDKTATLQVGSKKSKVSLSSLSHTYNGQPVRNKLDIINNILKRFVEHSKTISFNKTNHIYTLEGETNKFSVSGLLKGKNYNEKNKTSTSAGTKIDEFFKDFFTSGVKDMSEYNISKVELFDKVKDYAAKLKANLEKRGYTILTTTPDATEDDNGLKLYDKETKVAGAIDVIAVNELGDVIILDVKTSYKNVYNDKALLKQYLEQVNVYSYLFEKLIGVPVSKVGLLPIQLDVSSTGVLKSLDIVEVNTDTLIQITDYNKDYVASIDESGILLFEPNRNLLNVESKLKDKTIAEVIGLKTGESIDNKIAKVLYENVKTMLSNKVKEKGVNLIIFDELHDILFETFVINKKGELVLKSPQAYRTLVDRYSTFADFVNVFLATNNITNLLSEEELQSIDDLIKFMDNVSYIHNSELLASRTFTGNENLDSVLQYNLNNIIDALNGIISSRSQNTITDSIQLRVLHLKLLANIKYYLSAENLSTIDTVSFKDVIRITNKAFENSNVTYDNKIEILKDIYRLLDSIKKESYIKAEELIAREKAQIPDGGTFVTREEYDENPSKYTSGKITIFDDKTGQIFVIDNNSENKEERSRQWFIEEANSKDNSKQETYRNYKTIDRSIYIPKVKNLDEYISNTLDTVNEEQEDKTEELYAEVSDNLKLNNQVLEEDNNIFEVLDNLKTGTKVIVRNFDGELVIYYKALGRNEIQIGTIKDVSTFFNKVRISNQKGEFKGLSFMNDRNNIIALLRLLNTKDESKNVLDELYDYWKNTRISESTNSTESQVYNAKQKIDAFIKRINNSNNDYDNSIKQLLFTFRTNNLEDVTNIPTDNYSNEELDSVAKVLFFGISRNNLDFYKPNLDDVVSRMNYFNKIALSVFTKHNNLINAFPKDSNEIETEVENVTKPSILYRKNKESRKDLREVVATNGKPIVIVNKHTNIRLLSNGSPTDKVLHKDFVNKKNGLYVLVKNTNGTFSPVPLHSTTLGESYNKVLRGSNTHTEFGNKESINVSNDAIKYVTNTVLELLLGTVETLSDTNESSEDIQLRLVKGKVREIQGLSSDVNDYVSALNNAIAKKLYDSKLRNIVIVNGYDSSKDTSFPNMMFGVSPSRDNKETPETYLMFKTIKREANSNGGYTSHEVYHKYIVKHVDNKGKQEVWVTHITLSETDKDFLDRIKDFRNNSTKSSSHKTFVLDSNSIKDIEKDLAKAVPNLLRQTKFNSKTQQAEFGSSASDIVDKEFIDPITGKVYNDPYEYYLDTQSVTSDLSAVYVKEDKSHSDKKAVSNYNVSGDSNFKFSVSVPGTIRTQKEAIGNPLESLISIYEKTSSPYADILKIVRSIDKVITKYLPEVNESEHFGVTLYNKDGSENKNVIAQIAPIRTKDGLRFKFNYTNNVNTNTKSSINNTAFAILHEHLHRVLISFVEMNNLKPEDKLIAIKRNNKLINDFVQAFEKDFVKFAYNEDNKSYTKELLKLVENFSESDKKEFTSSILGFIDKVKKDVTRANTNIENLNEINSETIDSSLLAQEAFTYLTNPYVLHALSNINVESIDYTRKGGNNIFTKLIDKLIDTLAKIYNSIIKLIKDTDTGLDTEVSNFNISDSKYLSIIKEMFKESMYNFTSYSTDLLNEKDIEINNETKEEITTVTDIKEDVKEDETEYDADFFNNSEVLQDSKINSIFIEENISNITTDLVDDENIPIC